MIFEIPKPKIKRKEFFLMCWGFEDYEKGTKGKVGKRKRGERGFDVCVSVSA